jgi:diguanylate cyclase (GGDEF)-like protein
MARRLKNNTWGDDTVSRHGGDEFLYLLTGIHDEKDLAMIAGKIIKTIQMPCNVSARDFKINPSIGACIGISMFPKHGITADMLVKRADEVMYRAKENKSGYALHGMSRSLCAVAHRHARSDLVSSGYAPRVSDC